VNSKHQYTSARSEHPNQYSTLTFACNNHINVYEKELPAKKLPATKFKQATLCTCGPYLHIFNMTQSLPYNHACITQKANKTFSLVYGTTAFIFWYHPKDLEETIASVKD